MTSSTAATVVFFMTNRLSFLLRYALKRNTLPWYVQINDTDRDNIPDRYDVGLRA